ncbi:hypothetical protein SAMN04489806_0729 [Paramicrobacterium humi]|uniref:Uncharacterized protein n=1 Tax=Paramicrobacterium humi TaxID=640635 RepID=A0A1H4JKS2_9MICO|nr:hypothetical protein [Microbacterium humi]SEB46238.1 hypothetical protein SAMN04489806_0729 [Microbacterium humi]
MPSDASAAASRDGDRDDGVLGRTGTRIDATGDRLFRTADVGDESRIAVEARERCAPAASIGDPVDDAEERLALLRQVVRQVAREQLLSRAELEARARVRAASECAELLGLV